MEPEERVIFERDLARCRAEAERLRQLSGPPESKRELEEAWSPLLRTPGLPEPVCRMPYEAPELLP